MWKKILRFPTNLSLLLINLYRKFLSPLFPPTCRFHPTCSAYAIEAYQKHGFIRGSWLTLWRILRCQPFYKGCCHDPVPDKKETKEKTLK